MTKKQAKQFFAESYYGDKYNLHRALDADRLAVQEEWSIFVDGLCRDGEITIKQYDTWTFPWSKRR